MEGRRRGDEVSISAVRSFDRELPILALHVLTPPMSILESHYFE